MDRQDITQPSLRRREDRRVFLVGIGPGQENGLTVRAKQILEECDLFVGAQRMLEMLPPGDRRLFVSYRPEEIGAYLREHGDWSNACVLLSGDVGFFSGAKGLAEELADFAPELIPGISSLAFFCARLGLSWENMAVCSLHGRRENVMARVAANRYTFVLLDGERGLREFCDKLLYYGMQQVMLYVGEALGYPQERIVTGNAGQILEQDFGSLLVLVVQNPNPRNAAGRELADEEWIRGRVPMTKCEVRSVCLSKLGLSAGSVLYDIGAGTGSVAVQSALWNPDAVVYAVERREEALELIDRNRRKLIADNVTSVCGTAPEAFESLPAPTHAFIGGSGGRLREILEGLREKNPECRTVLTAVSLDTVSEVLAVIDEWGISGAQIVQISLSKMRKAGQSHMMIAENPVYVATLPGLVY